jgi:hypothetical protein
MYIVDAIEYIVNSMRTTPVAPDAKGAGAPYFMPGHRKEIANRLLEADNDKVHKYQKYPLFALRMDISEDVVEDRVTYNLNIAILALSDRVMNSEERIATVFKPILHPLYEEFFVRLRKSGIFMGPGALQKPSHTKIDRPYWGSSTLEGNTKFFINDPLDAVEIVDLKLTQRIKNC